MAEKAERLRIMYKIKKISAGIITIAICASMACILSGCKSNVDTNDLTYRLTGKLFDNNLPLYIGKAPSEINEDFDDLLEEGSEMYDKHIESEHSSTINLSTNYSLKTDDNNLFGGIVSFPESCVVVYLDLYEAYDDESLSTYISSLDYKIDIQNYVEKNNMDRSEKQTFFNNICNQFTDALVCDYETETDHIGGEDDDVDVEEITYITKFCAVTFEINYYRNEISIHI